MTVLAVAMALGAGVLMSVVVSMRAGSPAIVSPVVVYHLFVDVPLITACVVGLLEFAQLLLGMKENRIIALAVFIPVFAGLYGLGYTATGSFVASWTEVLVLSDVAACVLVGLLKASKRISKERIVASLP